MVAGLKAAGYRCGTESAYAICVSGPVEVWVLTGNHPRPPVVSLHSTGTVATARAAVGGRLAKVLATARIAEAAKVTGWYADQGSRSSAATTIGPWRIELSAETSAEAPGVHLTLTDKTCRTACQAE